MTQICNIKSNNYDPCIYNKINEVIHLLYGYYITDLCICQDNIEETVPKNNIKTVFNSSAGSLDRFFTNFK